MRSLHLFAILAAVAVAGCPSRNSDPRPDAADADPGHDAGGVGGLGGAEADGGNDGLPPAKPGKPLAEGCAENSECASGFCVDGVCCDSACDGQCLNCNQAGNAGYCTPQFTGDDLNAATPCAAARTCGFTIPGLELAACRLRTAQACALNADCASLDCITFYVDRDGDGFGGTSTLHLCENPGAPAPGGYSAVGGDCCDSDANAFPGQTKYFGADDGCGSWDYTCDGKVVSQNGSPVQYCGQSIGTGDTSVYDLVYCH